MNLNQALLRADRRSLFNACSKAASDGLLPDGREGALVIFRKKVKDSQGCEGWENYVQWMPMVYGIIKKARQSGEISVLDAQIVYSEELKPRTDPETGEQLPPRFVYKRVDGVPKIDHEPIVFGERGHATLVYSVVKFKDGSIDYEVLHADDVAKIRAMSKSKDSGPWSQWTEEMWKKSAIRRHAKRLPVSAELFETISRDDEITEFERQRVVAENKMLTAARTQLGASVEAEIIDPEPGHEATDHADESQVAATDYVDRAAELLRKRADEQPSGDDAPPSSSSTAAPQGSSIVTAATSPKERKRFAELPLSQQAGIRCTDPQFIRFMQLLYSASMNRTNDDAAAAIRLVCNVESRAEFDSNPVKAEDWKFINSGFESWLVTQQHADIYR